MGKKKKKGVNTVPCTQQLSEELENIVKTPYFWSHFQAVILDCDAFGGDTPGKQVVQMFHAPQAWVIRLVCSMTACWFTTATVVLVEKRSTVCVTAGVTGPTPTPRATPALPKTVVLIFS